MEGLPPLSSHSEMPVSLTPSLILPLPEQVKETGFSEDGSAPLKSGSNEVFLAHLVSAYQDNVRLRTEVDHMKLLVQRLQSANTSSHVEAQRQIQVLRAQNMMLREKLKRCRVGTSVPGTLRQLPKRSQRTKGGRTAFEADAART
ncbi:hypothetical protein HDU93_003317 [Gonapodya sp. JEL0774]|nr:hypothetical protein HDU93_003317 [Gonapodya sp. JEL0774]